LGLFLGGQFCSAFPRSRSKVTPIAASIGADDGPEHSPALLERLAARHRGLDTVEDFRGRASSQWCVATFESTQTRQIVTLLDRGRFA